MFFKLIIQNSSLGTCCDVAVRWLPQNLTNAGEDNIGSGNGLVSSGSKLLPEPVLTQFYIIMWVTRPQWVNPLNISGNIKTYLYFLFFLDNEMAPEFYHPSRNGKPTVWDCATTTMISEQHPYVLQAILEHLFPWNIFLYCILIKISLKFLLRVPMEYMSASHEVMAWHWTLVPWLFALPSHQQTWYWL